MFVRTARRGSGGTHVKAAALAQRRPAASGPPQAQEYRDMLASDRVTARALATAVRRRGHSIVWRENPALPQLFMDTAVRDRDSASARWLRETRLPKACIEDPGFWYKQLACLVGARQRQAGDVRSVLTHAAAHVRIDDNMVLLAIDGWMASNDVHSFEVFVYSMPHTLGLSPIPGYFARAYASAHVTYQTTLALLACHLRFNARFAADVAAAAAASVVASLTPLQAVRLISALPPCWLSASLLDTTLARLATDPTRFEAVARIARAHNIDVSVAIVCRHMLTGGVPAAISVCNALDFETSTAWRACMWLFGLVQCVPLCLAAGVRVEALSVEDMGLAYLLTADTRGVPLRAYGECDAPFPDDAVKAVPAGDIVYTLVDALTRIEPDNALHACVVDAVHRVFSDPADAVCLTPAHLQAFLQGVADPVLYDEFIWEAV